MKMQKGNLRELIDTIDWLKIVPTTRGYFSGSSSDSIGIKFSPKDKNTLLVEKIFIRFGKDVLEKLEWKSKDRLVVFNNPDDLLTFLICKSENNIGYSLGIEKDGKGHGRIALPWPHSKLLRLREENFSSVDYEIYKGYVSFRAEKSKIELA